MKKILFSTLLLTCWIGFSQESEEDEYDYVGSVIQTLTPSKLIAKGQFDVKWFNNLYTETKSTFAEGKQPRQTFFTATLEGYTGVSENRRVNVGLILEARSNVIAGRGALEVFEFDGESGTARSGFTSIAPAIKVVPFATLNNFSVQSAFFIPLVENEVENGVFLDQKGFTWQNRFFYDYTFPGDTFQIFTELNTEFNFGDKNESFANNSLNLIPGVFFSYFPSSNFTILALAQHNQRLDLGNNFTQDFTALGGGAKYQLTPQLNLEVLYTNFVRGNNTGLGETYNLGLRAVF
ncbi:MAG: hypothetical protein R2781_01595 [Flavobacteriaceae bacterium]